MTQSCNNVEVSMSASLTGSNFDTVAQTMNYKVSSLLGDGSNGTAYTEFHSTNRESEWTNNMVSLPRSYDGP
jgi:hypothetical protein